MAFCSTANKACAGVKDAQRILLISLSLQGRIDYATRLLRIQHRGKLP
jgi:hypothetical protein